MCVLVLCIRWCRLRRPTSPVQTGDKGSERSSIDINGHLISYMCINYNRIHSSLLACYAVSTSRQLTATWKKPNTFFRLNRSMKSFSESLSLKTLLRNINNYLSFSTAYHPVRLEYSPTVPCEPQILHDPTSFAVRSSYFRISSTSILITFCLL